LTSIFEKYGIVEFDPTNTEYDPYTQESIGIIPTNDKSKKNKVAETQRTGFKIRDRLLRAAYVVIYG
jgi:molecular chaperone GrpE (heat shock protein)